MGILRTPETDKTYHDLIDAGGLQGHCALCDTPATSTFAFWKLIPDKYPYDFIAETHDMLVPHRHAKWAELTTEELQEFEEIKAGDMQQKYDILLETTNKSKSIPAHYHLHAIILKK